VIHSFKTACCDHCAETGGSCGGHDHGGPAPVFRLGNVALPIRRRRRAHVGQLQCDPDGNCYDPSTGVYTTPSSGQITLAQVQASATTGTCAYGMDANGNCLPGQTTLPATSTSAFSGAQSWLTQNSTVLVSLAALVGILATVGGRKR